MWLVWTHSPPEPEIHLQLGRVVGVMPTNILLCKSAHKQTITPALAAHTCEADYHGAYRVLMSIFPRPWPAVLLMSRHVSLTAASGHWWLRDQRGMLWHRDQMSRLTPHPTSPQSRRWSDSGVCQENSSRHPTEKIDNILTILFQF